MQHHYRRNFIPIETSINDIMIHTTCITGIECVEPYQTLVVGGRFHGHLWQYKTAKEAELGHCMTVHRVVEERDEDGETGGAG